MSTGRERPDSRLSAGSSQLSASGAQLAAYLRKQRWYGEKGREIRSAELVDCIPVEWPESDKQFAVARVAVTTDAGTSHYQLFLRGDGASLDDALADADFRAGLAGAFARGATFQAGRARWVIESETETPLVVPADTRTRLGSAEQSNSSIIIGDAAILKLFRKLQRGINPDVEITRFLTVERRFIHTPVLLGTVHFADANGVAVAGMLQELVPGAQDGWTYALECSRPFFEAPAGHELEIAFEQEARDLGAVTRAMHETLASGDPGSDFAFSSAGAADVERWLGAARQTVERACATAERALAGESRDVVTDEVQAMLGQRRAVLDRIDQIGAEVRADAGANTRTHGDYHLGQALHSSAGRFLVIDFEGEPARTIEERRARMSPLRDVAGMLRSFAYAAAVGAQLDRHRTGDEPAALAESRARRWEQATRAAFFQGYFTADVPERREQLLPASQNNAARLVSLFEIEKAFYELQYELDHRPDWAWVPMRGITQLLA